MHAHIFVLLFLLSSSDSQAKDDLDWWPAFQAAVTEYAASIPTSVKDSLTNEAKGFVPVPIGFGSEPKGTSNHEQVLTGDFNGDGKPDFAIVGVNGDDPIAKALSSGKKPSPPARGKTLATCPPISDHPTRRSANTLKR